MTSTPFNLAIRLPSPQFFISYYDLFQLREEINLQLNRFDLKISYVLANKGIGKLLEAECISGKICSFHCCIRMSEMKPLLAHSFVLCKLSYSTSLFQTLFRCKRFGTC